MYTTVQDERTICAKETIPNIDSRELQKQEAQKEELNDSESEMKWTEIECKDFEQQ